MIGDSNPHEFDSLENKYKIDWRKETEKLQDMGVVIYSVEAFTGEEPHIISTNHWLS